MRVIIETQSITKVYTSNENVVRAVDNVTFRIHTGEFVALVGPSGSGKTTMLAILAALLYPSEGSVLIDGQDLSKLNEQQRVKFRREKIGFTFQSHNLIPYLTVLENVEMMLRLNGKNTVSARQGAKEILTMLGLEARLHYLPNQISGGQRQRVAIARSVVHNPRLVLADEPTANLDTERANQVVKIFADLVHHQDRCGIIVTHDLRMVKYVDKVLQMEDGKLTRLIENKNEILDLSKRH